jgi:hypothetical protein
MINEKALEISLNEYNNGAGEEGTNNSGPFVHKYLNGLAEPPANWCSAFVCWCIMTACIELQIMMPFYYSLSAKNVYNQFKEKNWIVEEPQPSDIIFFWRVDPNGWQGHIGFVYQIYTTDGNIGEYQKTLRTIEGNKGYFPAHVAKYRYDYYNVPQLLGYGRII